MTPFNEVSGSFYYDIRAGLTTEARHHDTIVPRRSAAHPGQGGHPAREDERMDETLVTDYNSPHSCDGSDPCWWRNRQIPRPEASLLRRRCPHYT